jgi:hypothetical protein
MAHLLGYASIHRDAPSTGASQKVLSTGNQRLAVWEGSVRRRA